MNIRLTLQVMNGDECTRTFDVEIYDHFGDISVTKWGQERSCEKPNDAAVKLAPLMFEGTTVLGNDANQKDSKSNSDDPPLAKKEEAHGADDSYEDDDADDGNDDTGGADVDAEEGNDDAGDANDDADEPKEEQVLGDDVSADADDVEVEESN